MRKISKILLISIVMIMIINCFSTESSAFSFDRFFWFNRTEESGESNFDVEAFEQTTASTSVGEKANKALSEVIGIVKIIATAIAISVLTIIACKYMIAAPGDRADIKKNAIPFVIGAVVVFGASGILGIIIDIASTITIS